jgi:DNA-directed RNA polymerase subunit alpha
MTSPTLVARNWRELIRPKNVPVDQESLSDTYGKFVVEPLERGFGITLGNSLRRVLLSSLQGAAITAVKIDGALHEFTSVPDVVEDVTEMVLNFKEVVVRSHTARTQTVRIEKEGPGIVTADDIQVTDQIEILNPEHKICTLAKGGRFAAELTINVGHGYVPADRNKTAGIPIGTIAIDSLFSPIRKVNYAVTNARVGQMTAMPSRTPPRSSRTSSRSSSTSKNTMNRWKRRARKSRSTRTCSARSTSSSSRCAPPTASRTPTSS